MKKRKQEHSLTPGFTLVEIMVAVVILALGILAVSQMTVMGMKVNNVVNRRMYARVAMSRVYENLQNLPVTDPLLADDGDPADLNVIDSTADHSQTITDSVAMYTYQARWNVADTVPEPGVKTVRIHILWGPNNRNHIQTDLLKRM